MIGVAAALARLAPAALLLLPAGLTIGPAVSEPCIGVLVAALLAHSRAQRDWRWTRQGWLWLALAWWGWLLACSLPGVGAKGEFPRWTLEALLVVRLPLCAAAIGWLLGERPGLPRWLHAAVVLVAIYVVAQLALQFLTGTNLFGEAVRDNGLLTGPFDRPRAGPTLMHLFFPVLLPPVMWLLPRWQIGRIAAAALLAAGVGVLLPIGQRMPLLLVGLGLVVSVWLLPTLRRTAIIAIFVGSVVLAAGAILFAPAQQRLVAQFAGQMADFPNSHYGLIYTRAAAMAAQHPAHGRGFAGFRTGCADPRYFVRLLDGQPEDAGGAAICVTHAHNLYLEALTDAGWPGLVLFSAVAVVMLITLFPRPIPRHARACGHDEIEKAGAGTPGRDPLQCALFIAALLHLWPVAASNAFANPYMGGWFVLLLGWGLARSAARCA